MFSSRRREVVFPQAEHARLAGHIAQHWGSTTFDHPPLPEDAFSIGVALHDLGFGEFDVCDLLAMSESTRRSTFEALVAMEFSHPTAEAVAKHHVLRLIRMSGLVDLERACLAVLERLIDETGVDGETFRRADTVTRLCDTVAFEFCLERVAAGELDVCARLEADTTSRINYRLDGLGTITLEPWPLSVPDVTGYLHAYIRDGYPDRLVPVWTPYHVRPT